MISISIRITLAAPDRTLTKEERRIVQERVIAALEKEGYPLKGSET